MILQHWHLTKDEQIEDRGTSMDTAYLRDSPYIIVMVM